MTDIEAATTGETKSKITYIVSADTIDAMKSLGWLSPADATAMAQAAQREAFEKAADEAYLACIKTGNKKYKTGRLKLPRDAYCTDYAIEANTAIRALTPSSGPWQRVPEGSLVVNSAEARKLLNLVGEAASDQMYADPDDKEALDAYNTLSAMLAEVKK